MRFTAGGVVIVALAGAASGLAFAASPVVVETNAPPVSGQNRPERVRPSLVFFDTVKPPNGPEIQITVRRATWRGWGRSTAIASGRARVDVVDISFVGRATVTLDRLRSHAKDGCGNRGTGRVYTRAVVALSRMSNASVNGSYTIRMPRTGCATRP